MPEAKHALAQCLPLIFAYVPRPDVEPGFTIPPIIRQYFWAILIVVGIIIWGLISNKKQK